MRSLERSRNEDLDQVDPEHTDQEGREFPWDKLKSVPFAGSRTGASRASEELSSALEEVLPEYTNRRKEEKLNELKTKMEELSSFGKNARANSSSNKSIEDFKTSLKKGE